MADGSGRLEKFGLGRFEKYSSQICVCIQTFFYKLIPALVLVFDNLAFLLEPRLGSAIT